MSLGPADVRRVAVLARLDLPEATLPALAKELSEIMAYVDRIQQASDASPEQPERATPLREDAPVEAPPLLNGFVHVLA